MRLLALMLIVFFSFSDAMGDSVRTKTVLLIDAQQDSPLRILHKPRASWGDGQDCSQGIVMLRIEFLKTGEIGDIQIVKGMTKNRNDASIDAAKQIKFRPARKDGETISVFRQVEFSFSFY